MPLLELNPFALVLSPPVYNMKKYKAINSFTQKPSPAQLVSYSLFLLQLLVFYSIVQSRYLSSVYRVAMLSVYSACAAIHLGLTVVVSVSDPSDGFMVRYKNEREGYSLCLCLGSATRTYMRNCTVSCVGAMWILRLSTVGCVIGALMTLIITVCGLITVLAGTTTGCLSSC